MRAKPKPCLLSMYSSNLPQFLADFLGKMVLLELQLNPVECVLAERESDRDKHWQTKLYKQGPSHNGRSATGVDL